MDSKDQVLVIGDNSEEARLILDCFKNLCPEVEVELARTIPQAFDYLFQTGDYRHRLTTTPKLILLDLSPANKAGELEILRVLKAYSRTRDIPVVVFVSSEGEQASLGSYKLSVTICEKKSGAMADFMQILKPNLPDWLKGNQPQPTTQKVKMNTARRV